MSKQDRQGVRTASELERKYRFEKSFAKFLGLIDETRDHVDEVESQLQGEIAQQSTSIRRDAEQLATKAEQRIEDVADELHATVTQQHTAIVESCRGILFTALEDYSKTEDFDRFQKTTQAALALLSDQLTMDFQSVTERVEKVNGELQSTKQTLEKHFSFSEAEGLTIRAGENTMGLRLDNDVISFTKNGQQFGYWDGSQLLPGSIHIKPGDMIRLGNGAITVFDDGSFAVVKAGD